MPKYAKMATLTLCISKMQAVFMKKKHKILYLADMRTTIASNNTKILEWEKFAFFLKIA